MIEPPEIVRGVTDLIHSGLAEYPLCFAERATHQQPAKSVRDDKEENSLFSFTAPRLERAAPELVAPIAAVTATEQG